MRLRYENWGLQKILLTVFGLLFQKEVHHAKAN
jgi:hypothetical protein